MIAKNPILSNELTSSQANQMNDYSNKTFDGSCRALAQNISTSNNSNSIFKPMTYTVSRPAVSVQEVSINDVKPIIPEIEPEAPKTKPNLNIELKPATSNAIKNAQYSYIYVSPIRDLPYLAKSYFTYLSYSKLSYVINENKIDSDTNRFTVFDRSLMQNVTLENIYAQSTYWFQKIDVKRKDNTSDLDFYKQKTTFKEFDYLSYSINNSYIDDEFEDIYSAYCNVVKFNKESKNIINSFNECKLTSTSAAIVFEGLKENEVNIIECNNNLLSKQSIDVYLSSMALINDDLFFRTSDNVHIDYDGTIHFSNYEVGYITAYSSANKQIYKTISVITDKENSGFINSYEDVVYSNESLLIIDNKHIDEYGKSGVLLKEGQKVNFKVEGGAKICSMNIESASSLCLPCSPKVKLQTTSSGYIVTLGKGKYTINYVIERAGKLTKHSDVIEITQEPISHNEDLISLNNVNYDSYVATVTVEINELKMAAPCAIIAQYNTFAHIDGEIGEKAIKKISTKYNYENENWATITVETLVKNGQLPLRVYWINQDNTMFYKDICFNQMARSFAGSPEYVDDINQALYSVETNRKIAAFVKISAALSAEPFDLSKRQITLSDTLKSTLTSKIKSDILAKTGGLKLSTKQQKTIVAIEKEVTGKYMNSTQKNSYSLTSSIDSSVNKYLKTQGFEISSYTSAMSSIKPSSLEHVSLLKNNISASIISNKDKNIAITNIANFDKVADKDMLTVWNIIPSIKVNNPQVLYKISEYYGKQRNGCIYKTTEKNYDVTLEKNPLFESAISESKIEVKISDKDVIEISFALEEISIARNAQKENAYAIDKDSIKINGILDGTKIECKYSENCTFDEKTGKIKIESFGKDSFAIVIGAQKTRKRLSLTFVISEMKIITDDILINHQQKMFSSVSSGIQNILDDLSTIQKASIKCEIWKMPPSIKNEFTSIGKNQAKIVNISNDTFTAIDNHISKFGKLSNVKIKFIKKNSGTSNDGNGILLDNQYTKLIAYPMALDAEPTWLCNISKINSKNSTKSKYTIELISEVDSKKENKLLFFNKSYYSLINNNLSEPFIFDNFLYTSYALSLKPKTNYEFSFDAKCIFDIAKTINNNFGKLNTVDFNNDEIGNRYVTLADKSYKISDILVDIVAVVKNKLIVIKEDVHLDGTFEFCYKDIYAKYGFVTAIAITDKFRNPFISFILNTSFIANDLAKVIAHRIYKTPILFFDDANSQINGNGDYDNLLPNILYYSKNDAFGNISKTKLDNNDFIATINNELTISSYAGNIMDIAKNDEIVKFKNPETIRSYDYDVIGYLFYYICSNYLKTLGWNKLSDSEDIIYYLILLDNLTNVQGFWNFDNNLNTVESFGKSASILDMAKDHSVNKIIDFFKFFKDHYYDIVKIWEDRAEAYELLEYVLKDYDPHLSLSQQIDKYHSNINKKVKDSIEKIYLVLTQSTEESQTAAKTSAMKQIDSRIWDQSTMHFVWKNVFELLFKRSFDLNIINDAILNDIFNYGFYPTIEVPEMENGEYVPYQILPIETEKNHIRKTSCIFSKADKIGGQYKWNVSKYPQYRYIIKDNAIVGIARDLELNDANNLKCKYIAEIIPNKTDKFGNKLIDYVIDGNQNLMCNGTQYVVTNTNKLKVASQKDKNSSLAHSIEIISNEIATLSSMLNNWEDNFYSYQNRKIKNINEILGDPLTVDEYFRLIDNTNYNFVLHNEATGQYTDIDTSIELQDQGYSEWVAVNEMFVIKNWKENCFYDKNYILVTSKPQIDYNSKVVSRERYFYKTNIYKLHASTGSNYTKPYKIIITKTVGKQSFASLEITSGFEDYWITDDRCNLVKMEKRSLLEAIRVQKLLSKLFVSEMTKTFYMVYALEKYKAINKRITSLNDSWYGKFGENIGVFPLNVRKYPSIYTASKLVDFNVKSFTTDYACLYKDMSYITGSFAYSYEYYNVYTHSIKTFDSIERASIYVPETISDVKYYPCVELNDDKIDFSINLSYANTLNNSYAAISIGYFNMDGINFSYVKVEPIDNRIEPFGIYPWNINKKHLNGNITQSYPEKWSTSTVDLVGLKNIRNYDDIAYYTNVDSNGWKNCMVIANNIKKETFDYDTAPMLAYYCIPYEWASLLKLPDSIFIDFIENDDVLYPLINKENFVAKKAQELYPKNKITKITYSSNYEIKSDNGVEMVKPLNKPYQTSKIESYVSNKELSSIRLSYSYVTKQTDVSKSNFTYFYETTQLPTNDVSYYLDVAYCIYPSTAQVFEYKKSSKSTTSYISGVGEPTIKSSKFEYHIKESDNLSILDDKLPYTYVSIIGNNSELNLSNNIVKPPLITDFKNVNKIVLTYSVSTIDKSSKTILTHTNTITREKEDVLVINVNKEITSLVKEINFRYRPISYTITCIYQDVPFTSYVINNNIQNESLLYIESMKAQEKYKFFLGSVSQWQIVQDNVREINEALEDIRNTQKIPYKKIICEKHLYDIPGTDSSLHYSYTLTYFAQSTYTHTYSDTFSNSKLYNDITYSYLEGGVSMNKGFYSYVYCYLDESINEFVGYTYTSYNLRKINNSKYEVYSYIDEYKVIPDINYFYDGRIDRDIDENKTFWTSSEIDAQNAWIMFFDKQMVKNNKKTCGAFVRPFIKVTNE